MNKILDFLGLEEKVLGGGQRYIPRFYSNGTVKCMTYCKEHFIYNDNIIPVMQKQYTERTALTIFGYIVTQAMTNPFFTLPNNVKEAIKSLHKTDRKRKVTLAENDIFEWFTSLSLIEEDIDEKYFTPVDYNASLIKNLCENTNTTAQSAEITTHLMGSLFSDRFGGSKLISGETVYPKECVYNNDYWPGKNPARGINIMEQKINNLILLDRDLDTYKLSGNTVQYKDFWTVVFDDDRAIVNSEIAYDELALKQIVLEAALIHDCRRSFYSSFTDRDDTAYTCDRFYYEHIKQNDESIIANYPEITIVKKSNAIPVPVVDEPVDESVLTPDGDSQEATPHIGMEITLSADGARNGDYDLGKMFGIAFEGTAPNRGFLKNVSITKQHLALCNKVIQSVYRIRKREEQGITDLGQLIGADFINVNFIGEPGTGKSFGLKIVSAILGVPLYIETFSGDSDTDKFQGTNSISKGSPTFEWTSVPTAHKNGGFCALEEVNQMRPDKTMAMSQALVDPFLLKVDNTMDVYRNPYTFYVNLFNVGTEGSKPFNEAYINRFGYTYDFCEDTQETEKKQLRLMLGYDTPNSDEVDEITFTPRELTDADFEMAVALKERVINYLTGDTVARDEEAKTISKRQCKEFLVEIQNGLDPKTSAIGTFVNTLKCVDRELAQEVMHNVIDVYPF